MTPPDDLPEPKRESWDVDAIWSRVRARTVDAAVDGEEPTEPAERVRAPQRPHARITAYAAAAVLLVAVGAGAWTARSRGWFGGAAADSLPGLYHTSRGQYATVRLADGSEVTLAPESRLTISARFVEGAREVSLDGEAIFSVRHDATRPFKVRARGALVQDIGTRFDLRAYAGDATVTVAVVEGAVALSISRADSGGARRADAKAMVLASGEVGTLDANGNAIHKRTSGAAAYLDWASGRLSFAARPLPEVLSTIGRWYDFDIRVSDARLARRLVTAEFSRQSSSEMLDALAIAMDATVERRGRVITLRPR
jgi:transmembrane sensor